MPCTDAMFVYKSKVCSNLPLSKSMPFCQQHLLTLCPCHNLVVLIIFRICYDGWFFFFFFGWVACGNQFPDQVLNSPLLHQKHGVLTTGLPGQSQSVIFDVTTILAFELQQAIPKWGSELNWKMLCVFWPSFLLLLSLFLGLLIPWDTTIRVVLGQLITLQWLLSVQVKGF